MTAILWYAALTCLAGGLVAAVVALLVTRNIRLALHSMLDLWLATGVIRLAQPPSWERLLTVVIIIAIRDLIGLGLGPQTPSSGKAPQADRHAEDPTRIHLSPGR